jgi:XTP/dITP diphosphohydrolase
MRRLVLASDNPGKRREFDALLAPLAVEVLTQGALGIPAAQEPHATFVENALAKARHAAQRSGLPALADDSGLCCPALGGAPGVRSARFGGEPADDARNNAELLCRLHDELDRRGHYVCVLAALRAAADPEPLIVATRWEGLLLEAPRGQHGFGYDPLFFLPELGRTAAELEPEHKNRLSHRGRAAAQLVPLLRSVWSW